MLLFASILAAQTTVPANTVTTPAQGTGHDYLKMLAETVNPADGSVSWRIRAPIPTARGATLPLVIAYDSSGVLQPLGTGNPGSSYWSTVHTNSNTSLSGNSVGGWSSPLPWLSASTYSEPDDDGKDTVDCYALTNYVFTDPSGGRHNLGIVTTRQNSRCFLSEVDEGGDSQYHAQVNCTSSDVCFNARVTVSDREGTVYHFPAAGGPVDYVEDRNGNKSVVANTTSPQGNTLRAIQDSLERQILSYTDFLSSVPSSTLLTYSDQTLSLT
jgi:hypothetical protein